jgi:hypothetical protein
MRRSRPLQAFFVRGTGRVINSKTIDQKLDDDAIQIALKYLDE